MKLFRLRWQLYRVIIITCMLLAVIGFTVYFTGPKIWSDIITTECDEEIYLKPGEFTQLEFEPSKLYRLQIIYLQTFKKLIEKQDVEISINAGGTIRLYIKYPQPLPTYKPFTRLNETFIVWEGTKINVKISEIFPCFVYITNVWKHEVTVKIKGSYTLFLKQFSYSESLIGLILAWSSLLIISLISYRRKSLRKVLTLRYLIKAFKLNSAIINSKVNRMVAKYSLVSIISLALSIICLFLPGFCFFIGIEEFGEFFLPFTFALFDPLIRFSIIAYVTVITIVIILFTLADILGFIFTLCRYTLLLKHLGHNKMKRLLNIEEIAFKKVEKTIIPTFVILIITSIILESIFSLHSALVAVIAVIPLFIIPCQIIDIRTKIRLKIFSLSGDVRLASDEVQMYGVGVILVYFMYLVSLILSHFLNNVLNYLVLESFIMRMGSGELRDILLNIFMNALLPLPKPP